MNKTNEIDKHISENSKDFNLWINGINNYLDYKYSDKELESKEAWKITSECIDVFADIIELCIKYGKFRDNWDYNHFYQNIYGPELIIRSLKTETEYRLGIDNEGIYLSTSLRFNENLRYMDDDYWRSVLNLSDFSGFIYNEYEFVSTERVKKFPELFNANKSIIYRILRKYLFDSTDTNSNYPHGSVGEFKIYCSLSEDFEECVKRFCLAFKIMYQLNYKLWKVSDLKSKKKI
ncbi:MAG: hypothetical protein RR190_00195 [Bacteroidales bacterium]